MTTIDRDTIAKAKRIVVKVGSNVLTENNGLNLNAIGSIGRQICQLIQKGYEAILVTSGAVASGVMKIGLPRRPDEIPKRQAAAAVGQAGLILEYEKAFGRFGKQVAQILLTGDGLTNRKRYLNARNTINTLLAWQVVPIINENDTVMVEEIMFGDNDNLAAMITLLMDADVLISLTDIDGLFTTDPRTDSKAELIPIISRYTRDLEIMASGIPGPLGAGGMLGKLRAAQKVTAAGVPMVIANGRTENILISLFAGDKQGTYFVPRDEKLASRKCWIAFTLEPQGSLLLDDGATEAIVRRGKSLLPSGILQVSGDFDVGASVDFKNVQQEVLGRGLVNYCSADIRKISGLHTSQIKACLGEKPYDEVVHRDNLVVFDKT